MEQLTTAEQVSELPPLIIYGMEEQPAVRR